jgi:hypothetical protein
MSNNEISYEAKKTRKNTKLAQTRKRNAAHRLRQRRKTPLGRLHADGSCRSENLARISHGIERIGAPNQRKLFCENDFLVIREEPRCRQSVPRIFLDLKPSKAAG